MQSNSTAQGILSVLAQGLHTPLGPWRAHQTATQLGDGPVKAALLAPVGRANTPLVKRKGCFSHPGSRFSMASVRMDLTNLNQIQAGAVLSRPNHLFLINLPEPHRSHLPPSLTRSPGPPERPQPNPPPRSVIRSAETRRRSRPFASNSSSPVAPWRFLGGGCWELGRSRPGPPVALITVTQPKLETRRSTSGGRRSTWCGEEERDEKRWGLDGGAAAKNPRMFSPVDAGKHHLRWGTPF